MAELTITGSNFEQEVLRSPVPVLLDFWASWCPPCRALSPILSALAAEREGRLTVGKVNVDEEEGLAQQYGINSIPTVLVFKNGKFVDQLIGLHSKAQLEALVD